MKILPIYSCISTTVWLHHLDSNKALREKARWELYKDDADCLEILEAASHKEAAVWPLASYHANHLSKTNKTC